MVERAITIILAGQQESDTTPLARWTRAVLRD
jgi:hypothetical protein